MWEIIGQARAVSLLRQSLKKQTLAHAYLFTGPRHVGKMTLALDLARSLNCEAAEPPCGECEPCRKIASAKHADVQILDLRGGKAQTEISIDQIREMQHSASLPPFEGRYKVYIIDGAELMSNEAANCLLKTLEEPTGRVVFILLSAEEKSLLATVVSRCQRLELTPLSASNVETALKSREDIDAAKAGLLAGLSQGRLGWAITAAYNDELLQQRAERLEKLLTMINGNLEERFEYALQMAAQFGQNRETVWEILNLWLDWWRDLLLVKIGCGGFITNRDIEDDFNDYARTYSIGQIKDFITRIQTAEDQLKQNANPQLVLEVLMFGIPMRGG